MLLILSEIRLIFSEKILCVLTMNVSLRHEEVNDLDHSHSNGHILPRFAIFAGKVL